MEDLQSFKVESNPTNYESLNDPLVSHKSHNETIASDLFHVNHTPIGPIKTENHFSLEEDTEEVAYCNHNLDVELFHLTERDAEKIELGKVQSLSTSVKLEIDQNDGKDIVKQVSSSFTSFQKEEGNDDLFDEKEKMNETFGMHPEITQGYSDGPIKSEPKTMIVHCDKTLIKHIRTHTGKKPLECPHCDAKLSPNSCLKIHLRTHTGEKPFRCTHCSAKFSEKTSLKVHIRRHTGVKPYECPHCGKEFSQRSTLNLHLRTHTGERPFGCTDCGSNICC